MSINKSVLALDKLLVRLIGEDIALSIDVADEIPPVFADPSHIEQVIMNLVVNACDAMPRGGKLRLITSTVRICEQDEDKMLGKPLPGECIKLSVQDSGTGIPEAIRDQIFEPFFSTKPEDQGTGLGLSTVFGIVCNSLRGGISFTSTPGEGTTFHIYPPVYQGEDEKELSERRPSMDVRAKASESVLLVEDDPMVREMLHASLDDLGYAVHAAGDYIQALELAEGMADPPNLLITDLVMPGKSGVEVAPTLLSVIASCSDKSCR